MKFSKETVQKVWEKGTIASNNDPNVYRKDECGAWIKRDQYEVTDEELSYGWTIEGIIPYSNDVNNDISNLKPLQWENNKNKMNGKYRSKVVSDGVSNKYGYSIRERQEQ
jgi:hypothetical protein